MKNFDGRCKGLLIAGLLTGLCMTGTTLALDTEEVKGTAPTLAMARNLPPAKEILDNAVKAMGGRDAIKNVKSSSFKAKMNTPMGDVLIESYYLNPDQFLIKQAVPGMGEITMASDGQTTWTHNPMMGYQLLDDEEVELMRDQASMHNLVVRLEKEFSDIQTVEQLKFNDRDCYKLRMLDTEGQEQFAYFDVKGHLMAGMEMQQATPMGPSKATMRFEDWKTYGDIKFFSRMVISQMGMDMTMEMTEVKFDNVDKKIFALPDEVKKLAAERKAATEESSS